MFTDFDISDDVVLPAGYRRGFWTSAPCAGISDISATDSDDWTGHSPDCQPDTDAAVLEMLIAGEWRPVSTYCQAQASALDPIA